MSRESGGLQVLPGADLVGIERASRSFSLPICWAVKRCAASRRLGVPSAEIRSSRSVLGAPFGGSIDARAAGVFPATGNEPCFGQAQPCRLKHPTDLGRAAPTWIVVADRNFRRCRRCIYSITHTLVPPGRIRRYSPCSVAQFYVALTDGFVLRQAASERCGISGNRV